ncbi:hypothetical protein EMPS_04409 [Entomortierella parvispora]|uniref:Uncharacterized protein n=1 Tax=Entomortierella parvispora TaxID=205924 RepID=A0A9P3LVI1_9FUNG|nr:hypothetical protein EMPS_04409 [Entomortierella parvispora]
MSSPRSLPDSSRSPHFSPATHNATPVSSSVLSSPRSPQGRPSTDLGASSSVPAMSTRRSPHLPATPSPIIAPSFAASPDNCRSTAINGNDPVIFTLEFDQPPPAYTPSASNNSLHSTRPFTSPRPTSSPVVIAVTDRFLDESSQIRHGHHQQQQRQQEQQQQQNRYTGQSANVTSITTVKTSVQVIEATPVHHHSPGSCMTRRVKMAVFMMLVVIIVLSALGGTVWRHDNNSPNDDTDLSKPTSTSASSTAFPSPSFSTPSSLSTPTPTVSSTNPWGPCKPGGCLQFSITCDTGCKANDSAYKSCVAGCNGDFFCTAACSDPQKNACFGTCTSQTLACLQQCGN